MSSVVNAAFVDPDIVVHQSGVTSGAVVVDFGCGSGFFSLAFARAVGDEGRVYAMDILPSALEAVASRAKTLGLTNVTTQRANLERDHGTKLEDNSVDWVIMKDILFQNKHQEVMLRETYRILRPGGRVFIMEWDSRDQSVGPDISLRIPKDRLVSLAQSVQLRLTQEHQVGDFHYAFVFQK
jgi:ubiquinone/menaquinone biosynthesis C-methylase UbiE